MPRVLPLTTALGVIALGTALSASYADNVDGRAGGTLVAAVSPSLDAGAGGHVAARIAPPPPPVRAKWWSYQPVRAPAVPAVQDKKWVRTPIDAFVLAGLEAKHLKPSPEADRALYIRRVTLDTIGYIPTPQEVDAFVHDHSADAYEKLVDRLLASPHYGERQARHWLDLARYADSTGFENDAVRPNMWRYRDYVVDSFNQDKPYDQFIKEQLAGDELDPGDKNALIATGFLANYPDNHNSRDLLQRQYQITTDITDTVGQVFLAQTVGCARCHDHKFDKISQKDYYQLQSFFANTSEVNDIPADIRGQVSSWDAVYQAQQSKYLKATKEIRAQRKAILDQVRAKGIQYHKERYLTDSREHIFKPESQWTAEDRWINHRLANVSSDNDIAEYLSYSAQETKGSPEYDPANAARWARYQALGAELKKFDYLRPDRGSNRITAMTELGHPDAPPTYVLFGGSQDRPLAQVQPEFPEAIGGDRRIHVTPTATSSGRRTALADWIASPQNPLTARVFVNRIWADLFGTGIVRTVSDFGRAGDRPTNPQLLDYLADNFVKNGWSVKKLQRQILLSSVYRQSSDDRPDVDQIDPQDRLLATFPRKRLDAEEIRDSLLAATGHLNLTVGGPSVFAPIPKGLDAGGRWPVSKNKDDWNRRSLYIFTRRSVAYPLLETFDMASPQQVHSLRDVTTTPLQALTLYNSDLVLQWSQQIAARVIDEAGSSQRRQLDRLYEILLSRKPDRSERKLLLAYLRNHADVIKAQIAKGDGQLLLAEPVGVTDTRSLDPIEAAAFVDLVHTVVNTNDFVYRF